jgi:D-arabinose 5-phosphate isomerase GutQ
MSEEAMLAVNRNREIDKLLKEEKKILDDEIRILVLGTGESGKTTV